MLRFWGHHPDNPVSDSSAHIQWLITRQHQTTETTTICWHQDGIYIIETKNINQDEIIFSTQEINWRTVTNNYFCFWDYVLDYYISRLV